MQDQYDGIIIGTGHNALVMQAYLCRSGLRVLSLDRADVPGGGLATIENPRFPASGTTPTPFFTALSPPCPGIAIWISPGTARIISSRN